jgi:hypothetical protein
MQYFCCNLRRREALRRHPKLNGIDYLEVHGDQTTLEVHFVNPLGDAGLQPGNFRIEGGERIRQIAVTAVTPAPEGPSELLRVRVDRAGDFSTYTLRLITSAEDLDPPENFDRILSNVEFSFKAECPSPFDCRPERVCPIEPRREPGIDYLARDYASFRRLMLDRLALLIPDWRERNPADAGIALVELLAYVGDHLSYQQEAIATEAYLGTARRRTSVRRHARLVDYCIHDGSNARVWVHLRMSADRVAVGKAEPPVLSKGTQLLTRVPGQPVRIAPGSRAYQEALIHRPEVFETLEPVTGLYAAQNELPFYTWGDEECCLPKGATGATLRGHYPALAKGTVLLLVEQRGPRTGEMEDADPSRRHAVRLVRDGEPLVDELGERFYRSEGSEPGPGVPVTQIEWHPEDALPFPFCISARTDAAHGHRLVPDVSVALGNMVLADHGRSLPPEPLGVVPPSPMDRVAAPSGDRCRERPRLPVPPRFRPALAQRPLTQMGTVIVQQEVDGRQQPVPVPFDSDAAAAAAFRWEAAAMLPWVWLQDSDKLRWDPRSDLLASGPLDRHFVAEVEEDGTVSLRFGDNRHGRRPPSGMGFQAYYRVGNGLKGSVSAGSLAHIVTTVPEIESVTNPLPATGGREPESSEEVRQRAPLQFRTQERAVTPDDYARLAERHSGVQRAAATFRWTGSWQTVFVMVDRLGGDEVDDGFKRELRRYLEQYRMAGHDLEVEAPRFVSLAIGMTVCVRPDYFRSDVRAALLQVFSSRQLPDGRRGLFHPDNFTFGQPVFLSRLTAAAQAVAGVQFVEAVTRLGRQDSAVDAVAEGRLAIGRLEIARLENDPNFPERGTFDLELRGGK